MSKSLNCYRSLCLLFFVFVGCHQSDGTKESEGNTKTSSLGLTSISINKLYHDFGDVKEGEILGCFFTVKNTGKKYLVIQNIELGCGCMSVNYSKKPLLAGDSTIVEVRFNSDGFYGKQIKVLQLTANIKEKVKELVIAANVIN